MDEMKVGRVSFSPRLYEGLYKILPDTGVYTKPVYINPDPAITYLRSLEWDELQCPSCFNFEDQGHQWDCKLAHALLCLHQKVEFREEK